MKRSITGHRLGQDHPRAKLTDAQVKVLRAKYQPGVVGYETLAKEFNCGVSTARDICTGRTRWAS